MITRRPGLNFTKVLNFRKLPVEWVSEDGVLQHQRLTIHANPLSESLGLSESFLKGENPGHTEILEKTHLTMSTRRPGINFTKVLNFREVIRRDIMSSAEF